MQNKLLKHIFRVSTRAGSGTNSGLSHLENSFPISGLGGTAQEDLATPTDAFASLLMHNAGTASQTDQLDPQANGLGSNSKVVDVFSELTKNLDKLRAVSEAQTSVLSANTEALTTNTASKVASQALATVGKAAGGFFGGLTALPIVSELMKLFGGGGSAASPPPLEKYRPPAPVRFDAVLGNQGGTQTIEGAGFDQYGYPRPTSSALPQVPSYSSLLASAPNANSPAARGQGGTSSDQTGGGAGPAVDGLSASRPATHVTVNVQAMDSRSFLDRSHDIAQAVREAMLNMHAINDVVNDL